MMGYVRKLYAERVQVITETDHRLADLDSMKKEVSELFNYQKMS